MRTQRFQSECCKKHTKPNDEMTILSCKLACVQLLSLEDTWFGGHGARLARIADGRVPFRTITTNDKLSSASFKICGHSTIQLLPNQHGAGPPFPTARLEGWCSNSSRRSASAAGTSKCRSTRTCPRNGRCVADLGGVRTKLRENHVRLSAQTRRRTRVTTNYAPLKIVEMYSIRENRCVAMT